MNTAGALDGGIRRHVSRSQDRGKLHLWHAGALRQVSSASDLKVPGGDWANDPDSVSSAHTPRSLASSTSVWSHTFVSVNHVTTTSADQNVISMMKRK